MKISALGKLLKEAGIELSGDNAPRLAAALAFYTILSLAPLFVIVIAIAGAVFGQEAATGQLLQELQQFLGPAGAEVVKTAVQNADKPKAGIIATAIGIFTLLLGASGVFGELQSALNTVWDVQPKPGRRMWDIVRDRFTSFSMVLVVGFLLLVSLILTSALSIAASYLEGIVPALQVIMHMANIVVSFFVVTALFAMIFKLLPDVKILWRDVWLGAAVTSAFFSIGKLIIGIYLTQVGVATPFGAAGSLVAFVVWIYYSALIMFFGAEVTQATVRYLGRQIEPTDKAEYVPKVSQAQKV